MRDVVDVARRSGMDCAHVDDQPLMAWGCYQTVGQMVMSVELVSADRTHVSMSTLVASNSLGASENEDPLPHILDFAKVVLPASYTGKETEDILKWAADGGPGLTKAAGPIFGSLLGNDDFQNLTVYFEDFELPFNSEIFDEFHVDDANAWAASAGLRCSQGFLDPKIGGIEEVRCTTSSGPRAGIDFQLAFTDRPPGDHGPVEFSDTDIVLGIGRCVSAEPGSKEALADIVASLVQRMSGSSADAARARTWVLTYVGANADSEIGTLNAVLSVSPDDTHPLMGDQVKVNPVGCRGE